MMKWSDKQMNVFNEWETTSNNLAIEACPGGAKSTVLVELLKRTPKHKKSIFLAFNKSIQQELEQKVPEGVETSTLHSMGFKILLKNTNQRYKVNEIKSFILAKKHLKLNLKNKDKENAYLFTLSKLVDLYRLNTCKNKNDLELSALKYGVDILDQELDHAMELLEYIDKYNRKSHKEQMMIDFVDMLYLPTILIDSKYFPKYDVVMVDETQDLNSLQWNMVQMLLKKRSRFCAVGDSFQSIYSFQGADNDVFNKIKTYSKTVQLPLSYSYRCSKKIAQEANKVFNFIESPEWMEDGEVVKSGTFHDIKAGDFILCRNNLPLIETFLGLLKRGQKAHIVGRDFGTGLLNVLNKMEDFSKESIEEILANKRAKLKEKGIKNFTYNASYVALQEKISILVELHKHFESLSKLKSIINSMFSDKENKNSITLSTIHKAKGREADNVYFLMPQLIPSEYAQTELEKYSEKCLLYVAITRAKQKLVYVPSISFEEVNKPKKLIEPRKEYVSRNEYWADR